MSEVDRVRADLFPQGKAWESTNDLESLIEEGVLLNNERLSEAFPREFERYCEQFITYFPPMPYHVKTTYDPSSRFGGWPEKKSRKTGRPLALIDSGDWLNRTDCVERHLDHEHWWRYRQFHGTDRGVRTEFYWLGMNMSKRVTFNAIDADNKGRIGWYGSGTANDPLMPVMEMPFGHFIDLKKLHDTFPDRIWCITSETLGLDIVERHGLTSTHATHERVKRQLDRIGLGHTEVHPMAGRCKRRPFGEHYRTITANGVLTTWQNQLDFFLSPGPTPTFRQIAEALLDALGEQWRCWRSRGEARQKHFNVEAAVAHQEREVALIRRWLDDDCPDLARTVVALPAEPPSDVTESVRKKSRSPASSGSTLDLSTLRGGRWAKELENIARNGLPAEDTVGPVVFEFAKWLWWIELYDLPEAERRAKTLTLLRKFVTERNNGHITRWNAGQSEDVLSQVERCLDSAISLDVPQKEKSLFMFSTLRERRNNGQYKRVILLEPLLSTEGIHPAPSSSIPSLSCLFLSVSTLEKMDEPLPDELLAWIDTKKGRNKVERYATRLCNFLFERSGWAYIPRQALEEEFLGYTNPSRIHKYNRILLRANVIDLDTYRAKKRPTGYRLTTEARAVIQQHRSRAMAAEGVKHEP